jgi:hypothetical protein
MFWVYSSKVSTTQDPLEFQKGKTTIVTNKIFSEKKIQLRVKDDFVIKVRYPIISWENGKLYLKEATHLGIGGVQDFDYKIQLSDYPPTKKTISGKNWTTDIKGQENIIISNIPMKAWKFYCIGTHKNQYSLVGNLWFVEGLGLVKAEYSMPGFNVEMILDDWGKI